MLARQHVDLIIFDLDGTLVEFPFEYFYSETHRILAEIGFPAVKQSVLENNFSEFDYFKFFDDPGFSSIDKPTGDIRASLIEDFWKLFDWSSYPITKPFNYSVPTLKLLKDEGFTLALATARVADIRLLSEELAEIGLLPFFDSIATRKSHQHDFKDKSQQINSILGQLNIEASRCVLIGDIPADIDAASQSELFGAFAVTSGNIQEEVLQSRKPLKVSRTIQSLVDEVLLK